MKVTLKSKLEGLQACRGIAALLVLLYHDALSYHPISAGLYDFATQVRLTGPTPFDFGHAGVDFFFVLSGFIILWVHQGDIGRRERIAPYARRRFMRVYPTYWLVLAMLLGVYAVRPDMGGQHAHDLAVIVKSFFLWPQPPYPIVTATWTLSHELLFYVLFAIILFHPRLGAAVFLAWLGLIAWVNITEPANFPLAFLGRQQNLEFFMGMAVAWIVRHRSVPLPWCFAVAGAGLFIACGLTEAYTSLPVGRFEALGYGATSALLVLGVVGLEQAGRLRVAPILSILGDASYSIYLTHMALLAVLARTFRALALPEPLAGWPAFVLMAVLATSGGVLFHLMVERPILRWQKPSARRRPLASNAP
ncbi:MAG TPA: acyltransferase [Magnetospirillum sp.]|jgi:peptidoglycan/LPS O-acetylase OafA/YrhL|nr:acyltransferase [Magnetospirillum sp.]